MEQLIQKYIRYFYIALIGGIAIQLLDVVIAALKGNMQWETFGLMFLSIINIVLLISNMRHNMKQQFTECKANAKLLRFTIALLIALHSVLNFIETFDLIMLGNHFMTIMVIEVVINYRIKSIEYLEGLANRFAKDKALDQKGG